MSDVATKAEAARSASIETSVLTTEQRNEALNAVADAIWQNRKALQEANRRDLYAAEALLRNGKISEAIVQRLKLDEVKIGSVVDMVRSVASLDDPSGRRSTRSSLMRAWSSIEYPPL